MRSCAFRSSVSTFLAAFFRGAAALKAAALATTPVRLHGRACAGPGCPASTTPASRQVRIDVVVE
jgi:hypothetical protein